MLKVVVQQNDYKTDRTINKTYINYETKTFVLTFLQIFEPLGIPAFLYVQEWYLIRQQSIPAVFK